MNEYRDEASWDSVENWVDIVLSFNKQEFSVYREIVLRMVPLAKQLKANRKITDWHFRYGCNRLNDVAFRLRSGVEHKEEVLRVVRELAEELKQKGLVISYNACPQDDSAWISSDEKLRAGYKLPQNWWWLVQCDELVSEVACKVLAREDFREKFFVSLHELLNMFWLQEIGGCFSFQPGISKQLEKRALFLTDESATRLKEVIDWRKGRSVEKKILALERAHGSQVEPSKKVEIEKGADGEWEERKLTCFLFFELLKTGLVEE